MYKPIRRIYRYFTVAFIILERLDCYAQKEKKYESGLKTYSTLADRNK
jgi:hypothetical protein